jgi:hypothetical protein
LHWIWRAEILHENVMHWSPWAVIKNVNKVDWAPSFQNYRNDWALSIRNFVLIWSFECWVSVFEETFLWPNKSRHFWSSFLVKIPSKVCPKYVFRIFLGFRNLKKTLKFWVFWPFFRSSRPRRGHVRNFLDYSSRQFFSLKFSHTKTLQPNFEFSKFYNFLLKTHT